MKRVKTKKYDMLYAVTSNEKCKRHPKGHYYDAGNR